MNRMPRVIPLVYFGAAHAALAAACLAVLWSPQAVAGFFYHARMVGIVHLITLGWITFSILGAIYVVGPMALRMDLPSRRGDAVACGGAIVGLIGMIGHFWIEQFSGMAWSAAVVAAAVLFVAGRMLAAVRHAGIPRAVKLHIALACINLYLAASAGLLLAFDKVFHFLPGFVIANVFAHAHLAAVGWVTMLVAGIGYRMLPMILPSRMPSGRSIYASAALIETGVIGLFVALIVRSGWTWVWAAAIAGGLAAFAAHVVWMVRSPAPKPPTAPRVDFGILHAAAAGACLAAAVVVGLILSAAPMSVWTLPAAAAYGVLGLLGFLSQMVVAVQVRLIPMYAWYWSFARSGGLVVPQPPLKARDALLQSVVLAGWVVAIPSLAAGVLRMSALLIAAGAWALLAAVVIGAIDNACVVAGVPRTTRREPAQSTLRIVPT